MTNQSNGQPRESETTSAIGAIVSALQAQSAFVSVLRDERVDPKHAAAVAATLGEDPKDVDTIIARFGQLADTNWWVIVQEAVEAAEAEYIAIAGRWFRLLAEALGGYDSPATDVAPELATRWKAVGDVASSAFARMNVYATQWQSLLGQVTNAPVNRDGGPIDSIRDLAVGVVRVAQSSVKDMTDQVYVAEATMRG